MAAVRQYPTKLTLNDDDFLVVANEAMANKISVEDLKKCLTDSVLNYYQGEENEGKEFYIDETGQITLRKVW